MALSQVERETLRRAQAQQKKRPTARVRPQILPRAITRRYQKQLVDAVREATAEVRRLLLPRLEAETEKAKSELGEVRTDAISDDIGAIMDTLSRLFSSIFITRMERNIAATAQEVEAFSVGQFDKQALSFLGFNVFAEPALAESRAIWVRENAALIKNVSDTMLSEIEGTVFRGISRGSRHEVIAKEIIERTGVSEKRARLIARDQVQKFNNRVTQAQHRSAGITRYQWVTSGDERVRDTHDANNGQIFEWNNPPATGHPGDEVNCRCVAVPVLNDLVAP